MNMGALNLPAPVGQHYTELGYGGNRVRSTNHYIGNAITVEISGGVDHEVIGTGNRSDN